MSVATCLYLHYELAEPGDAIYRMAVLRAVHDLFLQGTSDGRLFPRCLAARLAEHWPEAQCLADYELPPHGVSVQEASHRTFLVIDGAWEFDFPTALAQCLAPELRQGFALWLVEGAEPECYRYDPAASEWTHCETLGMEARDDETSSVADQFEQWVDVQLGTGRQTR